MLTARGTPTYVHSETQRTRKRTDTPQLCMPAE